MKAALMAIKDNLATLEKPIKAFRSNLGTLIDIALRYKPEGIHANMKSAQEKIDNGANSEDIHYMASFSVFDYPIRQMPELFEAFGTALPAYLDCFQSAAIPAAKLREWFFPLIGDYRQWYQAHEPELNRLEIQKPYKIIMGICERTLLELKTYSIDEAPASKPEPTKYINIINSPNVVIDSNLNAGGDITIGGSKHSDPKVE